MKCLKCKQVKPLTNFYWSRKTNRIVTKRCRECEIKRSKAYVMANRVRSANSHRKYILRTKYGISEEELIALNNKQQWACAICQDQWSDVNIPHIDHNHDTGQVRGLLCKRCNVALGLFGDRHYLVERALDYLIETEQKEHWIQKLGKIPWPASAEIPNLNSE